MADAVRRARSAARIHAATGLDALAVERLAPTLGAEIYGIDLADAARDDALTVEIRALLLRHKVLFFRDQDITPAQHVAFARRFGELEIHPVYPHHAEHPELVLLDRDYQKAARENIFHTDVSWRATPSLGSVLRCVECPEVGGDTIWVDMAAAYERLPQSVKDRIDGLLAMHDIAHAFGARLSREERAELSRRYPSQEHPVVRTHPETGAKILYVNQAFTTHFSNYLGAAEIRSGSDFTLEANALMNYLLQQAAIPEYQVRMRWRPDTIAFWDNRVTQHYAVADYQPAVRRMIRATIIGDRPR